MRLLLALLLSTAPLLAQDLDQVAPPALRREVAGIVAEPSVTTAVERRVRCAPHIYRSLLQDLPLAGKALRALELGDYAIEPVEGGCTIDDKAGARARCVTGLDQPERILVVARGEVDHPLAPRVRGTGVIHVSWAPVEGQPGVLQARCTVSFRLESRLLHTLTGPFRRLLGQVLGDKLTRLVDAAAPLAEAIQRDPEQVLQALQRRGEASPEQLQRFRERYLAH